MALVASEGFGCAGWDPAYLPDAPRDSADVVNLGYVINVVEDPAERAATLKQAWDLARRLLVVSAQVLMSGRGKTPVEFGDGVLTGRGTFQKFYQQDELKSYAGGATWLGRLPEIEEFPDAPLVSERFGSLKRAFAVVRRVTGEAEGNHDRVKPLLPVPTGVS